MTERPNERSQSKFRIDVVVHRGHGDILCTSSDLYLEML